MQLKIKKINSKAMIPTKGSTDAAAVDLYACVPNDEVHLLPNSTAPIPTGLAMEIPSGFFGAIYARSGLATKQGLRPANCVGIIDADYRGEIIVAMHNDSNDVRTIKTGERIAQFIIQECPKFDIQEVEFLDKTDRGVGGFGSTGMN